MRSSSLLLVAVLAAACSPEVIDSSYEKLTIQLRGPRVTAGSEADPFKVSKSLQATLHFYEDAAATKPYGADLDRSTLSDEVKDFKAEVTITGLDPSSTNIDVFGKTPFALPRLSDAQTAVYVRAEVNGLNDAGDVVARARCQVVELKKAATGTKNCKAFFGLVGRWNPIDAPSKARRRFAAAASGTKVLVAGGIAADPLAAIAPIGTAEVYDHVEGKWSEKPATPRYDLRATTTAGGYVVLTGGKESATAHSAVIESFDGSSLKAGTPLGAMRTQHAASLVTGDTVVLVGGWSTNEVRAPVAEIVKLVSGAFKAEALNAQITSIQRTDPCAGQVEDKAAVVCGGGSRECEAFDGTGFRSIGSVSFAAVGATRCAAAGGAAVFVGGMPAGAERKFLVVRKSAIEEVEHTDGSLALTDHAMAASNGKVVVAGGRLAGTTETRKATVLIDASGTVTPVADMNVARAEFDLAGLPDGTVLALGGVGLTTPSAEIFVVP